MQDVLIRQKAENRHLTERGRMEDWGGDTGVAAPTKTTRGVQGSPWSTFTLSGEAASQEQKRSQSDRAEINVTWEIRRGRSNGSTGDGQELTLHFDRRAGRQAGHRGRCGAPPQEGGRQPWADRKTLTRDWLQQNGATVPSRVRSVLASQTSVRDGTENSQDLLHDLCSVS